MTSLPAGSSLNDALSEPGWSPVDPAFLHKRVLSEVFLTHHRDAGDEHRFRLVIPRGHSTVTGIHVPTILGVEAIRQVGLALCQVHGAVPLDWVVVLQEASVAWGVSPPLWGASDHVELEALCRIVDARLRGEVMTVIVARVEMLRDGKLIGTGGGSIRTLPRRGYEALRRHASATSDRVRPGGASPLSRATIVEGRVRAVLGWTHPDPFFFDHPVDHVPGMLFAQAALDAHAMLRGQPARAVAVECTRFAELDDPVEITAEDDGARCVTVFEQYGRQVARVETR